MSRLGASQTWRSEAGFRLASHPLSELGNRDFGLARCKSSQQGVTPHRGDVSLGSMYGHDQAKMPAGARRLTTDDPLRSDQDGLLKVLALDMHSANESSPRMSADVAEPAVGDVTD